MFMDSFDLIMAENLTLKAELSDLKAACDQTNKELSTLKSQAAAAIKDINELAGSQTLSTPLESLTSILIAQELKQPGDKLTFVVSKGTKEWESPYFYLSPGYKMSVYLYRSYTRQLGTELRLLEIGENDKLTWPPDISHDIEVFLCHTGESEVPEKAEMRYRLAL